MINASTPIGTMTLRIQRPADGFGRDTTQQADELPEMGGGQREDGWTLRCHNRTLGAD